MVLEPSVPGQPPKGYGLSLSGGSSWWITGDKDNVRWINKLAVVMELDECASNGSSKLIFSKIGDTSDARGRVIGLVSLELHPSASGAGWVCYDHKTIRIWYHNSITDVICEVKNNEGDDTEYMNMWYALQPIYQRSICGGGLPLHAGLVEIEGRGVLLAAPGGTGKSTCCCRLPDYWKPLCDDEALVVLDKQKKYRAHPFPTWSDYLWKRAEKTWNVQYSVPLCGVFFLEQSETDEVVPVGEGQATVLINESAAQVCQKFWRGRDKEDQRKFRKRIFNNACEMAKTIPAFRLRVSLHGKFWEEMERGLDW